MLPRVEKGNITEIKEAYDELKSAYFDDKVLEEIELKVEELVADKNFKNYLELGSGHCFSFFREIERKASFRL